VDAAWSAVASQLAGVGALQLKPSAAERAAAPSPTSAPPWPPTTALPRTRGRDSASSRAAQTEAPAAPALWYPAPGSKVPEKEGWASYSHAKPVK
jgi:hypothetical protein